MALTVRLDARSERTLNAVARRRRLSRSDVVREALARLEAAEVGEPGGESPYRAWLDVIGVVSVGGRDAARTTGQQFTDVVRDKARARRAR